MRKIQLETLNIPLEMVPVLVYVFLLQENDMAQADKYAEVAMQADRYNPAGNSFVINIVIKQNERKTVLLFCFFFQCFLTISVWHTFET